ncbi:hypothetical protein FB468_3029 [Leucobacter komagatae]|uniref:Uncharacterized protein n=2 Tax=Leucobacter komagatae TaxID=55969 RepID=A0A542XXF0_9MICO|nr:hypothetical protein FB468_3029 [Leucobacter komagatae]
MPSQTSLTQTNNELLHTDDLLRQGLNHAHIARAVTEQRLTRIRRGYYVDGTRWRAALPEEKHLFAIRAAARATDALPTRSATPSAQPALSLTPSPKFPPVFSHRSAATLHRWPVWAPWIAGFASNPLRTSVTVGASRRASSSRVVKRFNAELLDDETLQMTGRADEPRILATSPERTLSDLARSDAFGVALVAADAHLRLVARVGRQTDPVALSGWRARMLAQAAVFESRPGSSAVRAMVQLADPRADSPLESISRMRFAQLGLDVDLQVPVKGPHGGTFFLDFYIPSLGLWGECDGRSKYTDARLRGGKSAEEIVYEEKRRADWITGKTGLRLIRWGVEEVRTLAAFTAYLRVLGVASPGNLARRPDPNVAATLTRVP